MKNGNKDFCHYCYTINWQNVIVLKALLDSTSKACVSKEENNSFFSLTEAWQPHHLKSLSAWLCVLQKWPATSFLIRTLMKIVFFFSVCWWVFFVCLCFCCCCFVLFYYRQDHSFIICYSGERVVLNKWTQISILLSPDDACGFPVPPHSIPNLIGFRRLKRPLVCQLFSSGSWNNLALVMQDSILAKTLQQSKSVHAGIHTLKPFSLLPTPTINRSLQWKPNNGLCRAPYLLVRLWGLCKCHCQMWSLQVPL